MPEMHNVPYFGHLGQQNTIVLARKWYFWIVVRKYIVDYIARCMECQKMKIKHRHLEGLLQPLPISK